MLASSVTWTPIPLTFKNSQNFLALAQEVAVFSLVKTQIKMFRAVSSPSRAMKRLCKFARSTKNHTLTISSSLPRMARRYRSMGTIGGRNECAKWESRSIAQRVHRTPRVCGKAVTWAMQSNAVGVELFRCDNLFQFPANRLSIALNRRGCAIQRFGQFLIRHRTGRDQHEHFAGIVVEPFN